MKHLLLTTIAAVVLAATAFAGPIHTAAKTGDLAGVQAELDKGVDVDEGDDSWPGMTPLHYAADEGHTEVVELLIANGVEVNGKDEDGRIPLHFAANSGHKEVVELLIANGADVNARDDDGGTPLDYTDDETADLLRKHDGKTGDWFKAGESIHMAVGVGHIEAVKQHLAAGTDVNAKNEWEGTPLHMAAYEGEKEIAELLIANGADVNAKDRGGFMPLDVAIINENTEIVDLLRKHDGKSGAEDSIQVAASVGNIEAVKQHLAAGADVNAKDDWGMTPLFYAAAEGHKEIVELLIAADADVNVADMSSMTPLHFAVVFGHKEIVELLIANGADVNAKGGDVGLTPLHFAPFNGHKEIAELLIANGADVNANDIGGGTPLDYANGVVANLLRKHGGKTGEELKALMPRLEYGKDQWPFGLSFTAKDAKTYVVEVTQDFKQWGELETIEGTGKQVKFIDPRQPKMPFKRNFYRVKVVE